MKPLVDKDVLRAHLSGIRNALSANERTAAETTIREALFSLKEWRSAPLIAGYVSVRGEIDLSPVWQAAATQGKGYALPCTVTDARAGQMVFRHTNGYRPEALIPARFGIPEPSEESPAISPDAWENALIIVPGLSFDDSGFRIGYGGGYYDRFLADLQARGIPHTTVGLVFSACRTPVLPHESHDVPVDIIIDERRIIHTHGTDGTH